MIILALSFAIIVLYQYALLKRNNCGSRERWISYIITGAVFVYGVFCVFDPAWVSPNNPIRFVFEPVQRWLMINQLPTEASQ